MPKKALRRRRVAALIALIGALPVSVDAADLASTPPPGGSSPLAYSLGSSDSAPGWQITPTLGMGLTWSDNVRLAADGSRVSDWSARVEPGVSMSGRSARASGTFRANIDADAYANEDELNRTNLRLYGVGTIDLYERRLMLDANASVSQERISSLGAPAGGVAYNPENTTELRMLSLSPFIRGQWGSRTTGELRYRATWSDSSATPLNNGLRQDWLLSLGNGATPEPFGWLITGNLSKNEYEGSNSTEFSNARMYVVYAASASLRLRADVGYERNTFGSTYGEEQQIYGGGFEWTPSPRTRVAGMTEQRFFGTGYNYEASWRSPLSSINLTFSRDVTTTSSTLSGGQLLALLAVYAESYTKQSADPDERLRLASLALIERGVPIDGSTTYVTNSYYLEKRAQLSSALTGVRHSAGLSMTYSYRNRLVDEALLAPGDELANFDAVEELGATLAVTHRLTPISNLSASFGASRSSGEGGIAGDSVTRRRSAALVGSTTFGRSTVGSLTYRHQASRGVTGYDENSVAATLGMRF